MHGGIRSHAVCWLFRHVGCNTPIKVWPDCGLYIQVFLCAETHSGRAAEAYQQSIEV
jgi:hypothetical protein